MWHATQGAGALVAGGMAFGLGLGLGLLAAGARAAMLGAARWVAVAALAVLGGLQVAQALGTQTGWAEMLCTLVLSVAAWQMAAALRRGVGRSVGQRGRARLEAARREQAQLRLWLDMAGELAPLGQWRLRAGAQTLSWSPGMYRLHGVSPADFTPDLISVLACFHEEDRQAVAAALVVLGAEGGNFDLRARLRRPDHELRHVVLRGQAQEGELFGVMLDVTEQHQTAARLRDADALVQHASTALHDMANEDKVTGIANRRQFDLSLVAEFKRAVRSNLGLGLVLVDVDHFQALNELHGRAAGDIVLRRVAQASRAVPRRAGDLVARYGGGQIAVLLPLADDAGALCVAAQLREAVRELGLSNEGGERGRVTVSCGAAAFAGLLEVSSPQMLVQRAEQALFQAKQEGRDRALRFDASMQAHLPLPFVSGLTPELERFIKSQTG